jgi:hypothetical protein
MTVMVVNMNILLWHSTRQTEENQRRSHIAGNMHISSTYFSHTSVDYAIISATSTLTCTTFYRLEILLISTMFSEWTAGVCQFTP